MAKKMITHGIAVMGIALFAFLAISSGSGTSTPAVVAEAEVERGTGSVERVSWSEYPPIPSKDYVVVGVVFLKDVDANTMYLDLREKAIEMDAHDIINVRLDVEYFEEKYKTANGNTKTRVVKKIHAVSALAIRYTNETLIISPVISESQHSGGIFGVAK